MHGLPRLVVYTSVDAHYSIKKLCAFEGIGSDNLYLINTDAKGKMDVGHLRQQIQRTLEENAVPIMVSATAGKNGKYVNKMYNKNVNNNSCPTYSNK